MKARPWTIGRKVNGANGSAGGDHSGGGSFNHVVGVGGDKVATELDRSSGRTEWRNGCPLRSIDSLVTRARAGISFVSSPAGRHLQGGCPLHPWGRFVLSGNAGGTRRPLEFESLLPFGERSGRKSRNRTRKCDSCPIGNICLIESGGTPCLARGLPAWFCPRPSCMPPGTPPERRRRPAAFGHGDGPGGEPGLRRVGVPSCPPLARRAGFASASPSPSTSPTTCCW